MENKPVDQQAVEQPTSEEKAFLEIMYNKEPKKLSQDEAVTLAQKGMNYDKLQEKYDGLANGRAMKFLNNFAEQDGVSVDEMIDRYEELQVMNEVKQEFPELSEEQYQRIMKDRMASQMREREERERMSQQEKENAMKQKKDSELKDFMAIYEQLNGESVDPDNIPEEVLKLSETMPLSQAYLMYDAMQNRKASKIDKLNSENGSTNPSSMNGGATDTPVNYDINNMTDKEVAKAMSDPNFRKKFGMKKYNSR